MTKGKLTKVDNGISQTRNTVFDNFGRVTETEQRTPVGAESMSTAPVRISRYTFNFAGALIEEEYPSGRKVKNEFESDGDLSRIFGKANASSQERTYASSFSYTPDGKIEKLRLGNGLWEAAKFNTRLQTTEIAMGHGVASGDVWKLGYEYGELDSNGAVDGSKNTGNIARQTLSFNGLAQPFVQSYKYDSLYRLTEARETAGAGGSAPQTWKQLFTYDRYGNRLTHDKFNGTTQVTQTNITHPSIDPNTNRFVESQGYDYDKNGNLISDAENRMFTFNGDNKQTRVVKSGETVGEYFYDGEGKRVKKRAFTLNGDLTEETVFVYSGGKLIAEYSTMTPPEHPTTSYTATDQLGSPRVLTNSAGEVVSRRDFLPFGEEILPDDTNRTTGQKYVLDGVRQKFTGYQKDEETNLDFAEARMYENRHGRFTAVDPLLASGKSASPQTFNRYVYVLNNPLVLTDPSGLQAATPKDDLFPCRSDCPVSAPDKDNTVKGNSAPLIDLVVDVLYEAGQSIRDFFAPGFQELVQTRNFGGSPDQTPKLLGNRGFTQRQFFNTSNQYIGEVGQLTLNTLTFIDPTGQASLPLTTFRWQNGRASNFEMGATTFGAILGPLSFGESGFVSKTPRAYSVAFQTTLDASEFGATRAVQANRANAALSRALESSPSFAAQMEGLIPGVAKSVSSAGGRKTPAQWVWHHPLQDQHTPFGTLQLVPIIQHRNPAFRHLFHPQGFGGFQQLRPFRQREQ